MIAVDTNVLVYAHRRDSPWHERASVIVRPSGGAPGSRRAWTGVRAEPFFGDNPPARLAGMHS